MKDYKSFTDKHALQYLTAFGLSQAVAHQFLTLVRKWEQNSGVEWTIKRLKSLKVAKVRDHGGLPPWTYSTWVKRKRRNSIPSGPVGNVWKSPFANAIGCFMIYTMYESNKPTTSQLDKFTSGVESTEVDPFTKAEISDILKDIPLWNISKKLPKSRFSSLHAWYNRNVNVPTFVDEDLKKIKSTKMDLEVLMDSATHPLAHDYFVKLYKSGQMSDELYMVYSKSVADPDGKDFSDLERNVVGSIGCIQEPGFKLRTIANPFPIFQVLLSRLGNQVYDFISQIPEDCTFDQDQGVADIQQAIKNGEELVALDLSSATDRFPANITFKILEALEAESIDIELFKSLSRGSWSLPYGGEISWTNGQPLGVYPSFGAFALSHHVVIQSLKPRFYRILGDDLVISKEDAGKALNLYQTLGVPISMDKSIDSPILTEFGGRIITSDRIFTQPKWREISDRSFIDLAQSIGPKVYHLLRPRQARIIKLLEEIPKDVHPFGMNWNPSRLSYDVRVAKTKPIVDRLASNNFTSKRSQLSLINRLIYENRLTQCHEFPLRLLENKADRIKSANGGLKLNSDVKTRVLANANINFIEVDEDCDETSDLVAVWLQDFVAPQDPRGLSTLERIERKLAKPKL